MDEIQCDISIYANTALIKYSLSLLTFPTSSNHHSPLRLSFFFSFLKLSPMRKNMQPLSFYIWLISLTIIFQVPSVCYKWQGFILLYGWIMLHCTYTSSLRFLMWWRQQSRSKLGGRNIRREGMLFISSLNYNVWISDHVL